MADDRTVITELGTALGMTGYATLNDALQSRPSALDVSSEVWVRLADVYESGAHTEIAHLAFDNGVFFARHHRGLSGRGPWRIEWSGGRRVPGDQAIPADLHVDSVYLISCKYLSRILHNVAPARVFDDCLAPAGRATRPNWFDELARDAHGALYRRTVQLLELEGMPPEPDALESSQRRRIQSALRERGGRGIPAEARPEYDTLTHKVSHRSAVRWREALGGRDQQERLFWRLIRLYASPYFVLGADGKRVMRLLVLTPWEWKQQYRFNRIEVAASRHGQPRVNWIASYSQLDTGQEACVRGHVEIRWSHGPFGAAPEAKVYLDTSPDEVPGYDRLDGAAGGDGRASAEPTPIQLTLPVTRREA